MSAYYLLGSRHGTLITLLFYAQFFTYVLSISGEEITQQAAANVIMSYLILTGVLYTYESSRERSYRRLDELLHREQELNTELKRVSITDKLTNIYNRVKLDEYLTMIYKRAKRYNEEFSVIIIDIDHFKNVNDTFGHLAGDEILIQFSKCIKEKIRASDIFGRWGGEEFLLILPNTSCKEANILAEHIRASIEQCSFSYKFSNSASFGVASFSSEESEAELIEIADKALYSAKESGRNCVKSKRDLT